jgi:D-glycero-D-manno-heptose 1,7-bisphosphate phosphatase
MKKPAVFLDRDGTVCEESNYLSNPENLRVFPFASEAIRILHENGFLAILTTNQSGIGRKFFDEKTLEKIHEKLQNELKEKLDAIYFCPHVSEDDCNCRKPKTRMIEQATVDFDIDLNESWMIGDKAVDVEAGFNAGTKTVLVLTGYGQSEIEKLERKPDLIAENLLEAARLISEK